MLMTASYMFPLHQGTLLRHWMVYQSCLTSVQSWMSTNKLKLNPNKTEFLLIRNEQQRNKYLSMFPIQLLVSKLTLQNVLRILGVIFDKNFTFHSHISAVCSSWFNHIQDPQHIHHYLDLDSAKLLAAALVSSHLVYCNSLCMVSTTQTSQNFNVFRINNPTCHDKVTSFYSQCSTAAFL